MYLTYTYICAFFRFALITSGQKKCFGIKRIETDCSMALISGVLQALEIGPTIVYLIDIWKCLVSDNPVYLVYHICKLTTRVLVS
jgi:hypothetical protein